MTTHILMTLLNIICIMVCTDSMRAAWNDQRGGLFIIGTIGVLLSAASLLLRVFSLAS